MYRSRVKGVDSIGEILEGMFNFEEIKRVKGLFTDYMKKIKRFSEGLLDKPFNVDLENNAVHETLRGCIQELYGYVINDIEGNGFYHDIQDTNDISRLLVREMALPRSIALSLAPLSE